MNSGSHLQVLGARLQAAANAGDWPALALADRELAALLPQLHAADAASPAMLRLRAQHRHAVQCCARATARMQQRLAAMRANQQGWVAYALQNENEVEEGTV